MATRLQGGAGDADADPERVDGERVPLIYSGEKVPRYTEEEELAEIPVDEEDLLCPPSAKHHPWLDLTRIFCVWFVAVDHGNSSFGDWNIMNTQMWVLQYLFLVCGVCYGMSNRGLGSYLFRLACYFVVGSCINLLAWIATRNNWQDNFFGVVFQFWFVAGLMLYAVMLAPTHRYLKGVREKQASPPSPRPAPAPAPAAGPLNVPETQHPPVAQEAAGLGLGLDRDSLLGAIACLGGALLIVYLILHVILDPILANLLSPLVLRITHHMGLGGNYWHLPTTTDSARDFVSNSCQYAAASLANCIILLLGPWLCKGTSHITWLVLLNTYGHRAAFYRGNEERPWHGLEVMMIGLTCYFFGLRGRRRIGEYVIRYWFVVLFACALLWPPEYSFRIDEDPPKELEFRVRCQVLEAVFVVVWLVAGDRLVQPEIFTEDRLQFLNLWALITFLVHKAVHMLIPSPWNWAFIIALAPVCWAYEGMKT